MRTVRIGAGAGFSGDRIEPAVEVAEKGEVQYLVFECLAERTIALAQQAKMKDPAQGYDPLLADRMRAVLPASAGPRASRSSPTWARPTRSPPPRGRREVARGLGLRGLKVAAVTGDDVLDAVRGRRLRAGRDRRARRLARQPAGLGQRLPRRRRRSSEALARGRRRGHHRPRRRPGAVPRAAGARVRLVHGRLDAPRPGHGGRAPAGVRRARSPAATSPTPASRTCPTWRGSASRSPRSRRTGRP